MAISIDFLANTRDFQRGVQDADDTLSKVSTSLDTVAKDGQASTQKLERSFHELAQASKRETVDLGTNVSRGVRKGTTEASEGVHALKENTNQNLKEIGASFNGTWDNAAGGLQGLVAEVLEGFGPAGLIAGVVAAGGLGLLVSSLQNGDTQTQAFTTDVQTLSSALIDAGTSSKPLSAVADQLKTLLTGTNALGVSAKDIAQKAKDAGVDAADGIRAYVDSGGQLSHVYEDARSKLAKLTAQQAAFRNTRVGPGSDAAAIGRQIDAQQKFVDTLGAQVKAEKEVAKNTKLAAESGLTALEDRATATQSYAEGIQSSLEDAGGAWKDYEKNQKVNLDKYNKNIEDSVKAIQHYQKNVVTASADLSQDALNYIESLGPQAAPLLQAYVDAPKKLKDRTADNWDALGKAASSSYTGSLEAGIPDVIDGPRIRDPRFGSISQAEMDEALGRAQRYLDAHPLRASAVAYNGYGKPVF